MEYNRKASDGTTYNNGYGICMIPKTGVTKAAWNSVNTVTGGYKSSTIHTSTLPSIVTKLQTVLGSHLINRNVLLSSNVNGNCSSSAYKWTTSYATLMSVGQMTGTFASHNNKYDDGEANYKLPLFNYVDYKPDDSSILTRCICKFVNPNYYAWSIDINGSLSGFYVCSSAGYIRPLIYLR